MAFLALLSCLALVSTALGCGEPDIYPVLSGFARVVNGEEAVPGSWPWQVTIQEKDGWHVCGGSLISAQWVVTSITCSISTLHLVVLGEHDRANAAEAIKAVAIAQVFNHPDWKPETKEFDIALIKLATPVGFTKTILPVCIPPEGEIYSGKELCVITGWGMARNNAFYLPDKLHQAVVPLLNKVECEPYYGGILSDDVICAGGAGSSACMGDIGGPLVCERYGAWYLIGISSLMSNTCSSSTPTVYTLLTSVRIWIDETVMLN